MSRAMSMKSKSASKQHGAIGLMMAVAMLALVLFAALAIDMARLTYQKQALQSVADIAALEVSKRNLYFTQPENIQEIKNDLEDGYHFKADGKVDTLDIIFGSAKINDDSYWEFNPNPPSDEYPYVATQVKVTKNEPKSMVAGGLLKGDIELIATASTQTSGLLNLGIGSAILEVDSTKSKLLNSIFNGLLGTSISISASSYEKLLKTNIKLGSIVNDVGVASYDELLDSQLNLLQLSELINIDDSVNDLLDAIRALNVNVNDIFNISPVRNSVSSALALETNAFDLIKAIVYAANKNQQIGLDTNIVGLADLNLTIGQPPQFTIANLLLKNGVQPQVKTEQIGLHFRVPLSEGIVSSLLGVVSNIVNGLLGLLLSLELSIDDLIINVDGAYAQAKLTDYSADNVDVEVLRNLGKITIQPIDIKINIRLLVLTQEIRLKATVIVPISEKQDQFFVNYSNMPYSQNVTNPFNLNPIVEVKLISGNVITGGALISPLVSSLTNLLSPLINSILIDTLSNLGVNLGTTTVWVDAAGTTQYGLIK